MTSSTSSTSLNRLLHRPADSDRGFTLIEVLVAMMVFAIVAVLVAYSLTLSMTLTRSNRASEVAANLAAQQIDIARSATDVFSVKGGTIVQSFDGTTYTITKTVGWLTNSGSVGDCGSGNALLQNKTMNVSVSWSGMRPGTAPVQASVLLAPAGPINDPASGTIIVHVTGASGSGIANVPVGAAPDSSISPNTATTINPAPPATDTDGCSFILKVVPGSYVVTIGKTGDGRISNKQVQVPTFKVPVTAGQSAVVELQYDTAATPKLTLSPGAPAGTLFPSTLPVTYAPQGDPYAASVTVSGSTASSPAVFPFASGYSVFAGAYVASGSPAPACLSVDPQQWTTPNASGNVGVREPIVATDPGSANTVGVPMPTVKVTVAANTVLVAKSATADASIGDPGCAKAMSLTFPKTSGSSATIALPYGSWQLYSGSTVISSSKITLPAGSPAFSSSNTFTLDPRQP